MAIIMCLLCVNITSAYGVSIWPVEIEFNHTAGCNGDAVDLVKNYTTAVANVEWTSAGTNEKFAYYIGQTNRTIKVKFNSDSNNYNFLVKATVTLGSGPGAVCEGFVAPCQLNSWATLYLSNDLPASVGIYTYTWTWEATALPYSSPYCAVACSPTYQTSHTFYNLLGPPTSPMAVPWTEVLDLACNWAGGKTTEKQALAEITTSAYYYFGSSKHYIVDTHISGGTINYTGFLNDPDGGDCKDMSAILHFFTRAIGGTQTQVLRIDGQFFFKKILPFGKTVWIDETNSPGYWYHHQVAWYDGVYDACIMIDSISPRIAVDETLNGSYKADLYDHGSWSPQTPFNYTSVE